MKQIVRCAVILSAVASAAGAQQAQQQALTLQESIRLAREHGLAGQAAQSAREAARWRERSYQARLLPQVTLQGNTFDYNNSTNVYLNKDGSSSFINGRTQRSTLGLSVSQEVPGTGGQLFVESGLTRTNSFSETADPQRQRFWNSRPFAVGFRQPLRRPNELRWNRREQSLLADAAERQYAEAREDVAERTADAFLGVYAAEIAAENARVNVAVNDTLLQLNKGRYEVGKIGENDLLQSELQLLRARNALDAAQLRRDDSRATLRRLLGLPAAAEAAIVPPTDVIAVEADPAAAVQYAVRNRSQITVQELQTVQAQRRINAARLNNGFGATVQAAVGTNQTALGFDGAYQSPSPQQTMSVSVEMPVFQWGGGRADVQAARAEAQRVASSVRADREALEQEARFAALQLTQSQRQLALAAKADTVANKRFEVSKNRYVVGKIGNSDLYIAQGEKDQARQAYAEALRTYWTAFYHLRRLTLYDFAANRPIGGDDR